MLRNPYGLLDGKIVTADIVKKGLACDCVCPSCGEPLMACQGEQKQPYFAHANNCEGAHESGLHLMAKEVIAEKRRISLPSLDLWVKDEVGLSEHQELPFPACRIDRVWIENAMEGFIPDLILEINDWRLLVEIKVTHGVTDEKKRWVVENDYAMVEYDLSCMDRVVDRDDLASLLCENGQYFGRWIHNPREDELAEHASVDFRRKRALSRAEREERERRRKLDREERQRREEFARRNAPPPAGSQLGLGFSGGQYE